jgi:hypothetical protein
MKKLLLKSLMSMWILAAICGFGFVAAPATAADADAQQDTGAPASEPFLPTPAPAPAAAPTGDEFKISIGGYLREHVSINLQDHPETQKNDAFSFQMVRSTVQLEGNASKGEINVHAVGRIVGEIKTEYLKSLENLGANHGDLMAQYNFGDLRELYVDFPLHERVSMRIGKQQVVWGETDFFQAMDVVHGFDYTWRSFLEGENEDYRKPLILVNATIQVPEANGSLQLILRPGLDRNQDIGSTYDIFGGRWIVQPFKGVDFLPLFPYNWNHPRGDASDPTWGARWLGTAGKLTYSLAYLRTLGPDPVFNSVFNPYQGIPITGSGLLGETIYLKNDRYGLTLSGYSELLDAVLSTELVYIKDQGYNFGTHFTPIPGIAGIITKDTVNAMVRMDKNLNLTDILGTNQPSFFTVQLFDKWIVDYKTEDDIVDFAGFQAAKKEHAVLGTVVLGLNYMASRVNPQIAAGYDFTYGGSFLIPSCSFAFGDKWRLVTEADLFFPKHANSTPTAVTGEPSEGTHLIGYFAHNDQLSIRLTRQF